MIDFNRNYIRETILSYANARDQLDNLEGPSDYELKLAEAEPGDPILEDHVEDLYDDFLGRAT